MRIKHILIKLLLLQVLLIPLSCQKDIAGLDETHKFNQTWELSTPAEQGLDSLKLQTAYVEAEQTGFMDALIIIKNGYIVAEDYYNGYSKINAHNVKSVSKSFLSAITGIALRENFIDNLDQKMLDFFPEYDHAGLDTRKRDITLRHLLTMRGGIEHERNNYSQIYYTSDWIKSTIEFPLTYDPGSTFAYNTFLTHLLSAILTKSSGMTTLELVNTYLLEPMNIELAQWYQGPGQYYFGGNNMFFTPRDMAVLGYLYLHNGYINGKRVIPAEWVKKSLENTTGFTGNDWWDLKNVNYGYLWWLGEMGGYKTFQAVGYGGQFVMCFPALDMIVVTTANKSVSWETSDEQIHQIITIISDHIMPAIDG